MVTIQHELPCDVPAREALLDRAFGVRRHRKTSNRLREGRLPAGSLAFSALDDNGRLIGTVRLWNVIAGSAGPALLLGPVDGALANAKGLVTASGRLAVPAPEPRQATTA